MTTATVAVDQEPAWTACPDCGDLIYLRRLLADNRVCAGCGTHFRLSADERIAQLLDPGAVRPLPEPAAAEDPLDFTDLVPYRARLRRARSQTGLAEAVRCVEGTVLGHRVVAAVMDFRFLGGSLGVAVGEAIRAAAAVAVRERLPLILVTASGGARMQEGALALMQMAKTSQALALMDQAGLLTVTVLTDPTYGGVAASFATLTDVILAEPSARVGFAGPRVIEQTVKQRLPADFQRAERLFERGLLDAVVPRPALRHTLGRLLGALQARSPQPSSVPPASLVRDSARLTDRDAWESVRQARATGRQTTLDWAGEILDDFSELHGDRLGSDCAAIVGGFGRLAGRPVLLVGHQKGRSTRENVARNFGMATPGGYRKAARLMRIAAKLGVPVVTLIDTPGADPGVQSEQDGQAWAIAENIRLMSTLPVPIVTVITGEGGSGGALALGVADRVLALHDAVYSVISPEGCAAILWKTSEATPEAARALRMDTPELLRLGIVDAVIPEPAHPADRAAALRGALAAMLTELTAVPAETLLASRRDRYARYGAVV